MMSSIVKKCAHYMLPIVPSLKNVVQCDTFSRSADAVFELSMRFADPFKISDDLSAKEKLEAERLMFLELTQGPLTVFPVMFHPQVNQCASGETLPIFLS